MTVHCPLCDKLLTPAQRRLVSRRIDDKKKKLSVSIDALLAKHRKEEAKTAQAAEGAYERGRAAGEKTAAKGLKSLQAAHRRFVDLRMHKTPPALLARPRKLLARLRKWFPRDTIRCADRDGGIVQHVRFKGCDAGRIVYRCLPDAGSLDELDTRKTEALKERCNARAGIQVVRSARAFAAGPGLFIIGQKMVTGFAALVRKGILLAAESRENAAVKSRIMSEFGV